MVDHPDPCAFQIVGESMVRESLYVYQLSPSSFVGAKGRITLQQRDSFAFHSYDGDGRMWEIDTDVSFGIVYGQ